MFCETFNKTHAWEKKSFWKYNGISDLTMKVKQVKLLFVNKLSWDLKMKVKQVKFMFANQISWGLQ